mmetsp:Transcript_93766/g.264793  ORF Transcript_93766/g.264793 Transcript_93766/m.264793 type:complete len:247 (+) Transcript_93766:2309-3049(+)
MATEAGVDLDRRAANVHLDGLQLGGLLSNKGHGEFLQGVNRGVVLEIGRGGDVRIQVGVALELALYLHLRLLEKVLCRGSVIHRQAHVRLEVGPVESDPTLSAGELEFELLVLRGVHVLIPIPMQVAEMRWVLDVQNALDILRGGSERIAHLCATVGKSSAHSLVQRLLMCRREQMDVVAGRAHVHVRPSETPRRLCTPWRRRRWHEAPLGLCLGWPLCFRPRRHEAEREVQTLEHLRRRSQFSRG